MNALAGGIAGTVTINLPEFIESQNTNENELFASAQEDFINCMRTLIQSLLKTLSTPRTDDDEESGRSVVVLPPLSRWAMYATENVVKECFTGLTYFVAGPADGKRVVICHEELISRKVLGECLSKMVLSSPTSESTPIHTKHVEPDESQVKSDVMINGKIRKPDKPVYIPKALREEAKTDAAVDEAPAAAEVTTEATNVFGTKKLSDDIANADEENHSALQPEEDSVWTKLSKEHLIDIYHTVGEVFLFKPDWSNFGLSYDIASRWDSSSLGHLLELFDFPPGFVEKDITEIFKDFQASGFWIHWTDDSHAIIRFPSQEIAGEALATVRHPQLKCRPICIATRKTKTMLAKHPDKTLPYKRRPKTECNAAKRIILTSLGLGNKPNSSPSNPK